MDRHICKAKAKDSGKWIAGYYFKSMRHDWIIPINTDSDTLTQFEVDDEKIFFIEVDPKTVCSCAGVPDKNGKTLFEHDIVKMRSYGGGYHESAIYFKNGKFAVDGSNYYYKDIRPNSVEFVRNKFDNPELLEV